MLKSDPDRVKKFRETLDDPNIPVRAIAYGARYQGEWDAVRAQMHGFGIIVKRDGSMYVGTLRNN